MGIRWTKMLDHLSAAEQAARDGFSAVQIEVGTVAALTAEHLRRQKELFERLDLSVSVCTTPLPPEVRVTQKGFNIYVWTEYLKKAVRNVAELGCDKIAWADGRARLLPVEGDTSGARQQVLQFVAMLCDAAAQYGITILVEPLGPLRTNFLNNMDDVAEFISTAGRDNLSSRISLRELEAIALSEEDFDRYSRLIRHVQMENPQADPATRVAPRSDDGFDYGPFLRGLRRVGYDGAITLPLDAGGEQLTYCKLLWDNAG